MTRRLAALLALLALVLAPGLASSESHRSRVVVLSGVDSDARYREAELRIAAELRAAGFIVATAELPATADPRSELERAAQAHEAFAAVAFVPDPSGLTADVWVVDRVTGKAVVRRVSVRSSRVAPRDLAVRAVELLQASLLEVDVERRDPAPAPPDDVRRFVPPRSERDRELFSGFGLAAGVGLLQNAAGISAAVAPVARLSVGLDGAWASRLSLVGPALGAKAESSLGSASVRQELALLEILLAPAVHERLIPVFSLGAGVYHLDANGSPEPPRRGKSDQVTSAIFDLGAGAAYRLTPRTALTLELHGFVLTPRPVVTIAETEIGSAGRPGVLATFGVMTTLL